MGESILTAGSRFRHARDPRQPQARHLLPPRRQDHGRGNRRYWFSKSTEGDLVDAIPEGYEVYENPDAQVFLRKVVPQLVTPFEVAVVTKGLERYAPGQNCIVDVKGGDIVVYHVGAGEARYQGVRFGLSFRFPCT